MRYFCCVVRGVHAGRETFGRIDPSRNARGIALLRGWYRRCCVEAYCALYRDGCARDSCLSGRVALARRGNRCGRHPRAAPTHVRAGRYRCSHSLAPSYAGRRGDGANSLVHLPRKFRPPCRALGMACLVAGAAVLSWSGEPMLDSIVGPLAIAGACVAWGLDNNLTRKVSLADPLCKSPC